jgi:hypothetical protein
MHRPLIAVRWRFPSPGPSERDGLFVPPGATKAVSRALPTFVCAN